MAALISMQTQKPYYPVKEFKNLPPKIVQTIIFAHYGSTGGDSFTQCLLPHFEKHQATSYHVGKQHRDKIKNMPADQRSQLRFIYGHWSLGLDREIEQGSVYITLLRHPVKHFISQYYWAKHAAADRAQRPEYATSSLRQWVDIQLSKADPQHTGGYITDFFSIPSYPWKDDWKTKTAKAPLADKTRVALATLEQHFGFVGITDKFEESLFALSCLMGWEKVYYWKLKSSSGLTPAVEELPAELVRDIKILTAPSIAVYTKQEKRFDQLLSDITRQHPSLPQHITNYKKHRTEHSY